MQAAKKSYSVRPQPSSLVMENEIIIPQFTPKSDIEDYQYDPTNGQALHYLTTDKFWQSQFKPLDFFNLLYHQIEIVYANCSSPKLVKRHILNLELNKFKLLLLIRELKNLIDFHSSDKSLPDKKWLFQISLILSTEYNALFDELFCHQNKAIDNPDNNFDYAREIMHLETLKATEAKHQYLQNVLSDYASKSTIWDQEKRWEGESFERLITKERDRLYTLLNPPEPIKTNEISVPQLSVNQVALIHHYKGIHITKDNADKIASDYGYTKKYSGKGLLDDYTFFAAKGNRLAIPDPPSKTKFNNKIKLLESVIEYLDKDQKEKLMNDIDSINSKYIDDL